MESELVFKEEEFLNKLNSIIDNRDKFNWIAQLKKNIVEIYKTYNDSQLRELFFKYNLYKDFKVYNSDNSSIIFISVSRISSSDFSEFLLYLRDKFIPYLKKQSIKIAYEALGSEIKKRIDNDQITIEQKYPIFNYNYSLIKYYSELYFPLLVEKLDYYEYIMMKFSMFQSIKQNSYEIQEEEYQVQIDFLKHELVYLHSKYDRENNNRKSEITFEKQQTINNNGVNANSLINNAEVVNADVNVFDKVERDLKEIMIEAKDDEKDNKISILNKKLQKYTPKNKQENELIKHYINLSLEIGGIPSLELLASEIFSKASWSKKLREPVFLGTLLIKVNSKLKHSRLSVKNKEIYIHIRDFINEKVHSAKNQHSQNAGLTSKSKPAYNDNISDEIQNEFDNLS